MLQSQQLLALRAAAYRLLSCDTATRIPTDGVFCIASLAEAMEQVRVKLDGVLKDNLSAAHQVQRRVSEVVDANTEIAALQAQSEQMLAAISSFSMTKETAWEGGGKVHAARPAPRMPTKSPVRVAA